MKTHTLKLYQYDELSDKAKEKACEYVRNNQHDLGDYVIDEMIDSLKALQKEIGGDLDYSISIVPDRGEFVRLTAYDKEALKELAKKKDDCPLTGVCYDIDIIEGILSDELEYKVLKVLHDEGEYIYSDEGIGEMIEANEYTFLEDGTRFDI